MVGFIVPAMAIAYSLATSAYAAVNFPALLALAHKQEIQIPGITIALAESGVHVAAVVSLLLACAVVIPCFLSSRTAMRVIGGALIFIPSFLISSLIFLAVFYPLQEMARAAAN